MKNEPIIKESKANMNYQEKLKNVFKREFDFTVEYNYGYGPRFQGLIKLSFALLEYHAPKELRLKTGKLISLLATNANGFSKQELLRFYYTDYVTSSASRQLSLEIALDKVICRARKKYRAYGLNVKFDKASNNFLLCPIPPPSSSFL